MVVVVLVGALAAAAGRVVISAGDHAPRHDSFLDAQSFSPEPVVLCCELPPEPVAIRPAELVAKKQVPPYPHQLPNWRIKLREALEKPIDVCFSDTPFETAIAEVAGKTGIRIDIDLAIDVEDYRVSLRLREIAAKNCLALVCAVDENLAYNLRPEGIYITFDKNVKDCETEEILWAIEYARGAVAGDKERRKYLRKRRKELQATQWRDFDWYNKSIRHVIREMKAAWKLEIVIDPRVDDDLLDGEAPQASFCANAVEALRWLEVRSLSWCHKDGDVIFVSYLEDINEWKEWHELRAAAFEEFAANRIPGQIRDVPLHGLISAVRDATVTQVYADRQSWETGIKITLPGENPKVKELLDYLDKNHAVKHWFKLDCDTGRETLYLLKSH